MEYLDWRRREANTANWLKNQLVGEVPQNVEPPPLFDAAIDLPKWAAYSPDWKIDVQEYPRPHRFVSKSEVSKYLEEGK